MAAGSFLFFAREAIFGRTVERVLTRFANVIRKSSCDDTRQALLARSAWQGLVFEDLLPRGDGMDLLAFAREQHCEAPAIVIGTTFVSDAAERAFALGGVFVVDLIEPGIELWAKQACAVRRPSASYDASLAAWVARYGLTSSERAILQEAAAGAVYKDIARKRAVTCNTIKRHVSNLLDKTGDETLSAAALRLLREALLE